MSKSDKELQNIAKDAAAKAVVDSVKEGMTVGLGTGSTAAFFIKQLADHCRKGLKIKAVCTSKATEKLAIKEGIPLISIDTILSLDLAVDGADELDEQSRMIKGGGGALLREKIVAAMSKRYIILIDESKQVNLLGKAKVPVEILPFAHRVTMHHLSEIAQVELRCSKNGKPYITDNRNYIADLHFDTLIKSPREIDQYIKSIPGVVETGFFIDLATTVVIGFKDGHVEVRSV